MGYHSSREPLEQPIADPRPGKFVVAQIASTQTVSWSMGMAAGFEFRLLRASSLFRIYGHSCPSTGDAQPAIPPDWLATQTFPARGSDSAHLGNACFRSCPAVAAQLPRSCRAVTLKHTTFRNAVAHSPLAISAHSDASFRINGILDITPENPVNLGNLVSLEEFKGRGNESAVIARDLPGMQADHVAHGG